MTDDFRVDSIKVTMDLYSDRDGRTLIQFETVPENVQDTLVVMLLQRFRDELEKQRQKEDQRQLGFPI